MTSTKKCLDFNSHLNDNVNTVKEYNLIDDDFRMRHRLKWGDYVNTDKNLLKQYISKKFLLKCWKKDIIFNLIILSKYSILSFFDVIFPIEIIFSINYIYIELRKEAINRITYSNFCPCRSWTCLQTWYNSEAIEKSIEYIKKYHLLQTPFEINWNLYHCDGLNKVNQICHNIFLYDDVVQDCGFYCLYCNRTYCINCQATDLTTGEGDERCFECLNRIK
jgi:hypothetical protein